MPSLLLSISLPLFCVRQLQSLHKYIFHNLVPSIHSETGIPSFRISAAHLNQNYDPILTKLLIPTCRPVGLFVQLRDKPYPQATQTISSHLLIVPSCHSTSYFSPFQLRISLALKSLIALIFPAVSAPLAVIVSWHSLQI